jgi:hypothetical protein
MNQTPTLLGTFIYQIGPLLLTGRGESETPEARNHMGWSKCKLGQAQLIGLHSLFVFAGRRVGYSDWLMSVA